MNDLPPRFSDSQREELERLGLYPEQVQRLKAYCLLAISWRQTRPPGMREVKDRLTDLAKSLDRVERLYVGMETSGVAAAKEALTRLQLAADELTTDQLHVGADQLLDSLETATNIVNRALKYLSPIRRSTQKGSAEFVRLIMRALQQGHAAHFRCTGFGDASAPEPMPPFEICVSRKGKFGKIALIVSEASGNWSADDAIRSFLKKSGGKLPP